MFNVYNKGYSSCLLSYLDIWSTILFFYPLSGIVLFCALCRITSGHIDQIQMEVDELIAHKPIDMVDRVKRLAENYFYITELVHQINHCFGLILLFILSTHVVLIYTGIVFISSHYKNGNDWYDFVPIIYYSIVFSVNILAVSFASDAVSKKVLLRSSILHELVTLNIYATLHLVFTGSFPTGEIQQTLVSFFYPKVRGRHNKCNSLIFWRSQA